jgi:hypothetical protein
MWFFFSFRGSLYATHKENWLYGIVEGMTEIIRAVILMAGIIIQSHNSVGIGKGFCFILHDTGLFMGKSDKSHCRVQFCLCKASETSNKQELIVFQ